MWTEKARDVLRFLNLELSHEQQEVLFHPSRLKLIGGGEGAGKSFLGALTGVVRGIVDAHENSYGEDLLYWVVGADFEDARKELEYIHEWLDELGLVDNSKTSISTHKDQKCILTTTIGVVYETVSGYDPKKIGREQPQGIIGCEISRWPKEVWDRCYGRLARRYHRGSWGFFSGSFETSEGWFPEMWEVGQSGNELDVASYSLPAWANLSIYPEGENDPAIQQLRAQTTEPRFMARYGGKPHPPIDSVFHEFKHVVHVDSQVEFDPNESTYIFIDPGDLVYACEFVQFIGDEVWVVDELYVTHWTHEQVMQGVQNKPAWNNLKDGVMDIAGTQHHMGLGSAFEAWHRDTGLQMHVNKWPVDAELERLRSVLSINPSTGRPRLRVSPKCQGLIAEMGGGVAPVHGINRWKIKNGKPEPRNDHACKALSYGLLEKFGTARIDDRSELDSVSYLRGSADKSIYDSVLWHNREGVNPWQPT